MIKNSFNFLFWGSIIAFGAYHISHHFDSFEIASAYVQEEKYDEADIAISKYNAGSHRTLNTVNGYILQSDISNQLDRLYVSKELATHALEISQQNNDKNALCISQNALKKSQLLIGDLTDIENPLLECLSYFKNAHNDFDIIKTLNNLVHFYMLTDNKKISIYVEQAQKIVDKKDTLSYLMVDLYTYNMLYLTKEHNTLIATQMIQNAIQLQKKHFSQQPNKLAYLKILSVIPMLGNNNLNALQFLDDIIKNNHLQFNISMKIHTLIIMAQLYQNLDDYHTSLQFTLKALDLLHTFPNKEVHAIETSLVYQSLLKNYQNTGNIQAFNKARNEAQILLENFPILQHNTLDTFLK